MNQGAHEITVPQEDDRVHSTRLLTILVVSLVVFSASLFAAGWMLGAKRWALGYHPGSASPRAAPREIGMIDQTLVETEAYGPSMRARQRRVLEHYGWVNRAQGIARIPIARAMELLVQRAAPGADGGAP